MSKLDLTTHVRAGKTGQIIEVKPYRVHIENKVKMFEMPKGSGQFFYENGEPIPADKCPKLTPVIRMETEEMKLEKIQKQIAAEAAELEKLKAEKMALQELDKPVQAQGKK
jgi:hypothetical protein